MSDGLGSVVDTSARVLAIALAALLLVGLVWSRQWLRREVGRLGQTYHDVPWYQKSLVVLAGATVIAFWIAVVIVAVYRIADGL